MNIKNFIIALSLSLPCFAAEPQAVAVKPVRVTSSNTRWERISHCVKSTLKERATGAIVGTVIGAVAGTGMPIPMGPRFNRSQFMVPRNIAEGTLLGTIIGFVLIPEIA